MAGEILKYLNELLMGTWGVTILRQRQVFKFFSNVGKHC